MLQFHQAVIPTQIRPNGTTKPIVTWRASTDGVIESGFLRTDFTWPVALTFAIRRNSDTVGSFVLPANSTSVSFSGVNAAVIRGDKLELRPYAWTTFARIGPTTVCQLEIDDGKPEGYSALSTTSRTFDETDIGEDRAFTVNNRFHAYVVGSRVRVIPTADPDNYFEGTVTTVAGTSITVTIDYVNDDGGTFASWSFSLAGTRGEKGDTGDMGPIGVLVSQTFSFSTASIADGATETGSFTLAKDFKVKKLVLNEFGRVRLYKTEVAAIADAARMFGDRSYRGNQHQMLLDINMPAELEWIVSPDVLGSNGDDPETSTIYYNVTNLSGGSASIDVDVIASVYQE